MEHHGVGKPSPHTSRSPPKQSPCQEPRSHKASHSQAPEGSREEEPVRSHLAPDNMITSIKIIVGVVGALKALLLKVLKIILQVFRAFISYFVNQSQI